MNSTKENNSIMNTMKDRTLDYYNTHSAVFTEDTVNADMHSNQDVFLRVLEDTHAGCTKDSLRILDLGCGAGRDLRYFKECGYIVCGTDGSEEMVRAAAEYSGVQVDLVLFEDYTGTELYDAVWACASILHMHKEDLPDMFRRIRDSLKEGGILYSSFKYGTYEGYRNERYYTDLDEERLRAIMADVPGFALMELWISGDVRPGRETEKWLNFILQKENV